MAGSPTVKLTFLADSKDAQKGIKDLGDSSGKLEGQIGHLEATMGHVSTASKALGAALTGAGIGIALKVLDGASAIFGKLKGSVIDTNATLEQSKQGWTIMLGGAEAAQAKIDELYKFAADTPFEFGEVDKAARLLETFGGAALDTKENLALVGDIAAATDQPFSDVAMWVGRMYSAMQNGQPFGEAAARLQEMGALSGEARTKLEQLQESGASGEVLWAQFNSTMGRFSGTMKAQAGTFNGLISTVQDTFNQLAATAGKPIFEKAQQGLKKLAEALSSPKVAEFAQVLASKLAVALDLVWRLIERAWPPVQRFVMGIFSAGKAVFEATQAFAQGKTTLAQYIGGMEIFAKTVFGNLGGLAQKLGPILGSILGTVVAFAKDAAPQIGAQLAKWGALFGDWVQDSALPWLGEKLVLIGGAIATWIKDTGAPAAADAALALAGALSDWVQDTAIPFLQKNLPIWWAAFSDWLGTTAVPALVTKAKELAGALADWVVNDAIPFLRKNLPIWVAAITDWLRDTAIPAVKTAIGAMAQAFGTWIGEVAIPYLQKNLPLWLAAIGDWLRDVAAPAVADGAKKLGGAMVDGIIAGLRAAWDKIKAELTKLAEKLPEPVQHALGIQSPSKVFADKVGIPIVGGIIEGIRSQGDNLDRVLGGVVGVPGMGGGSYVGPAASFGGATPQATGATVVINQHISITAGDLGKVADRRALVQEIGSAALAAFTDVQRGGPPQGIV